MSSPEPSETHDTTSPQPQPIPLSPDSRKDRKSKSKDPDFDGSASSASTRKRASSNGSVSSTGSHRHHRPHFKSKSKQTEETTTDESNDDTQSTTSTRSRRHFRHRSKDPDSSDEDNDDNNNSNVSSDGDDDDETVDVNVNEGDTVENEDKKKRKNKESTRKRASSSKVLPSATLQSETVHYGSPLRQPVMSSASTMSSLANTYTLGSVGNSGNGNGIIKSGMLVMKMEEDNEDNNSNNDTLLTSSSSSTRNTNWHEGYFVLYQDGTFDERMDESNENIIFSGTVRSIKKMDDTKEIILNETRYTHFVKVLLAVPSGQGMIRQVAVDLGMKTDAELSSWTSTFEACDTYILKPIKPVGSSLSSMSSLSTMAKSKREAKSEWAIKKSESSQLNFMITKRGWVKYRGVMKQWSLRLFVLKPPMLIYYKDEIDESKEAASGIINLHNCNVVKRESKKDGFCFKIYSLNEKHSIYASRGLKGEMLTSKIGINASVAILRVVTQEEGLEWIRAIEEAIAYANFCQDGTFAKLISSSTLTMSGGGSSGGDSLTMSSSPPATMPRMVSQSMSTIQLPPQQQQQQSSPSLQQPQHSRSMSTIQLSTNSNANDSVNVNNVTTIQTSPSVSPISAAGEVVDKNDESKKDNDVNASSSSSSAAPATTTTVTYSEKDVEELVSFQGLKFLEPRPTNFVVEVPREEMKIDAFEQGKNIILQLMKQVKPGMDLTKVTLPTHILEPRSFLEKMTDYFTHIELLSK